MDYFAGAGSSLSFYGETLNILLVGYLILLSLGLWWLMRRIVNGISDRVTPDTSTALSTSLSTVPVSRRLIAAWAVACALVIIPIGAALSPAWDSIRKLISGN